MIENEKKFICFMFFNAGTNLSPKWVCLEKLRDTEMNQFSEEIDIPSILHKGNKDFNEFKQYYLKHEKFPNEILVVFSNVQLSENRFASWKCNCEIKGIFLCEEIRLIISIKSNEIDIGSVSIKNETLIFKQV